MIAFSLITIIVLLFCSLLFMSSRFVHLIAFQFICVSMMMLVAVVYMSKVSTYQYMSQIDYDMYLRLSTMKLRVMDIAGVYNLCFALFMLSQVLHSHFLRIRQTYSRLWLTLPIIAFLIWNDYNTSLNLFFLQNTSEHGALISSLTSYVMVAFKVLFIAYMLLPLLSAFIYYRYTQIFVKKADVSIMAVCIALVNLFVYVVFVTGIFSNIMFNRVSASKLPQTGGLIYGHYTTPMFLLMILVIVILATAYFRPFNFTNITRKREIIKTEKIFDKNISMSYHVYKNAFYGISQRLMLAEKSITEGDGEKALLSIRTSQSIVSVHMDMMSKTLALRHSARKSYDFINLSNCIIQAIAEAAIPGSVSVAYSEVSEDIPLLGNSEQLTEAFKNILINAVESIKKRNPEKPYINIKFIKEFDLCVTEISDNGIGIKRKDLKKVFQLYYSSKSKSGSGIGLAYTKRIISAHHGEIVVKSAYGSGATFQVALPIHNRNRIIPVIKKKWGFKKRNHPYTMLNTESRKSVKNNCKWEELQDEYSTE